MDQSARFSALIGEVYDAAVDPSLWGVVLGAVRDFVGGSAAGIVTKDAVRGSGGVCYDDGGFEPEYTESYFDRYVALDPCTTGHFFSTVDNPVSTGDLIPYDEFLRTRFYDEWAKPQGFVDYIATALHTTGTTAVVLNVMRRRHEGLFDDGARHRMRLIAPHVQRAVMIGQTIDQRTAKAEAFAETMDGLSAGIFLIDASGGIVHANDAGRELLGSGDALRKSGNRLAAANAKVDHALRNILRSVDEDDESLGTEGIALPLPATRGGGHVAHVLPLAGGGRRRAGRAHCATAAIFVRKADAELRAPPAVVARHFRLTPTELRVLLAIVDVGGVPEAAESLGIADTTVKTHLRRLYEKTGAARQADLVKLVARFASPLVA